MIGEREGSCNLLQRTRKLYHVSSYMNNWFTKILFKISPELGVKYLTRKMDTKTDSIQTFHSLFSAVKRVDVHPLETGFRGFALVLNQETALYFIQDGEHFKYKGYEVGKFEGGDVRVFDKIRK